MSKELEEYKKDNRKGIYIIREDKTVKISKNLITINDEFVILIKCEPLRYYNSYYYIINYEIDKLKSKGIYIDNKKIEEDKYKIKDKYYLIFNFENTFNDETRKLKVIYEIQNEFLYYSSYQLYMNEKDVLMKYEITVDDDIQIDDVTNEYFKKEKGGKLVLFEGKTTNEIIVKSGSLVFSKKINYQIYNYIPKFKNNESDIIHKKETNNQISTNILAIYKKVRITNEGQENEDLLKIKTSNFSTNTYIQNYVYPLLMDTEYKIELVEINGQKAEFSTENSLITILNIGAFNNQFEEFHLKYKYINEDKQDRYRQETIIVS